MTVEPRLHDDLAATMRRFPGVRLALLFGSRATGRASARSDVDLGVIAPAEVRYPLACALTDVLGRDVDLVDLSCAGVPLLEEILRDGVVVYEGTPGAAAIWRSHTLVDLELDRRWYRTLRDAWLARLATGAPSW